MNTRPKKRKLLLRTARVYLFSLWLIAFLVYIIAFFSTSSKEGVTFDQASRAAWNIAYVLLPILVSFASFWLADSQDDRHRTIEGHRLFAIFALTAVFHVVILCYFSFAIFSVNFVDPASPDISFSDRVESGIKWLLLLSALAVLPVGYVLGGKAPSLAATSK